MKLNDTIKYPNEIISVISSNKDDNFNLIKNQLSELVENIRNNTSKFKKRNLVRKKFKKRQETGTQIGDLKTVVTATISAGQSVCFNAAEHIDPEEGHLVLNHDIKWELKLDAIFALYGFNTLYQTPQAIQNTVDITCDCFWGPNYCWPGLSYCELDDICISKFTYEGGRANCVWFDTVSETCYTVKWLPTGSYDVKRMDIDPIELYYLTATRTIGEETQTWQFDALLAGETMIIDQIALSVSGSFQNPITTPIQAVYHNYNWIDVTNWNLVGNFNPTQGGWIQKLSNKWTANNLALASYVSIYNPYCEESVRDGLEVSITTHNNDITREKPLDLLLSDKGIFSTLSSTHGTLQLFEGTNPTLVSFTVTDQNIAFTYKILAVESAECIGGKKSLDGTKFTTHCWVFGLKEDGVTKLWIQDSDLIIAKKSVECESNTNCSLVLPFSVKDGDNIYSYCFYKQLVGKTCIEFVVTQDGSYYNKLYYNKYVNVSSNPILNKPSWDFLNLPFDNLWEGILQYIAIGLAILLVIALIIGLIIFIYKKIKIKENLEGSTDSKFKVKKYEELSEIESSDEFSGEIKPVKESNIPFIQVD
jgi:hypothetical protein